VEGLAAHDPREFYGYAKPTRVRGGITGAVLLPTGLVLAAETTPALAGESRVLSRPCDARRYER
jgi:hypothetical protein